MRRATTSGVGLGVCGDGELETHSAALGVGGRFDPRTCTCHGNRCESPFLRPPSHSLLTNISSSSTVILLLLLLLCSSSSTACSTNRGAFGVCLLLPTVWLWWARIIGNILNSFGSGGSAAEQVSLSTRSRTEGRLIHRTPSGVIPSPRIGRHVRLFEVHISEWKL